ncbi:MAG: response regulator [Proteobacteria bacterium]|nr:response regulator [Desulfobacula sp.]MBU3954401.1 response regulator [Pseudomonadota bacterium]MBU4131849.1 response regulator [Pseudomonadota bacterium]
MNQETILIIDDEFSIRDSLLSFFQDEGYRVLTAENGETGLALFFKEKVDVVLTDLRMPQKDGIEVMNTIREKSPDTPMVVVSGAGRREDIINALRMGAKDYITKPVEDLEMIHHVIRKALENKRLVEENRQYRKQLEKSEARYRTITQQIAEGVFTMDAQGNLTFTNQAFCNMVGYSSDDLCNMNLKELSTPDSFVIIEQQTKACKNGLTGRYEIQMRDSKQKIVHVELASSPLPDEKNHYNGAISVVRDITKLIDLRKRYQKFLREQGNKSKNMLAICASCKSIRDKNDGWTAVEDFFTDIVFSHGICPDCCEKLYPGFDITDPDKDGFDI